MTKRNRQKNSCLLIAKIFTFLALTWLTAYFLFVAVPENPLQIKTIIMLYLILAGLPSMLLGPPMIDTIQQTTDYMIPLAIYWLAIAMLSVEIHDRIKQKQNTTKNIATTVFILTVMILVALYILVGMKIYRCQI